MKIKELWQTHSLEVSILGILMVMMTLVIYSAYSNSMEQEAKLSVDLTDCEKVGTAADQGKTWAQLRTIYKCNDGMIYIR